jgi:hypothetical protein
MARRDEKLRPQDEPQIGRLFGIGANFALDVEQHAPKRIPVPIETRMPGGGQQDVPISRWSSQQSVWGPHVHLLGSHDSAVTAAGESGFTGRARLPQIGLSRSAPLAETS